MLIFLDKDRESEAALAVFRRMYPYRLFPMLN